MSRLLMEIRQLDRDAASVLEKAGFGTDSDIQSLTREDLHELFPGCVKLKLRRAIFEKAQKHKPIDVLLRELKSFIPDEHLRAASTGNGVLADYLNILKDMKTQMNKIQSFLDAHIDLLQGFNRDHPVQGPDTARCLPDTDAVGTSGQIGHNTGPADGRAQGHTRVDSLKQRDLLQVTVKYKKVVTGKTFKANEQLMGMVMANFNDRVEFIESEDDAHTIIVFCPITSRIGSDVDAAMSNVRDDKPVILVLMHHTHEVKCTTSLRTWEDKYTQVVLHVSVFYHETVPGLLQCKENNLVVPDIQRRLWENSIKHAGKNALDINSYLNSGSKRGSDSGGYSLSAWFRGK